MRPHAAVIYRDSSGAIVSGLYPRWHSSDETSLWVTESGDYTTAGDVDRITHANLVVTVAGLTASHTLTVVPLIYRLSIAAGSTLRAVGLTDTLPHVSAGLYGDKQFDTPDTVVRWRSSDSTVISVEPGRQLHVKRTGTAWLVASLLGAADSVQVRGVAPYRAIELPESENASVVVLNKTGDVLGRGNGTFVWYFERSAKQEVQDCPYPQDLNDRGEVLCTTTDSAVAIWRDGVVQRIGGIPERHDACLQAKFNTSHTIAYVLSTHVPIGCGQPRLAVLKADGSTTNLAPPAPPTSVLFIDDGGNIGIATGPGGYVKRADAASWDGFSYPPPYPSHTSFYSHVLAANARGYMVGSFTAMYQPTRGITRRPGESYSVYEAGPLVGINSTNAIVGHWNALSAGFLGSMDDSYMGRLRDLTLDETWTFGDPLAINDRGMIVANATRRTDGHKSLVILVPPA